MKLFSILGGKKTSQANVNTTAYTKEFTYLPSYHWVQSTEYTPSTTEETLAKAKYLIHNTKDTQVYEAYKAILIKDGWTITKETAVINFSAKKDTHIAHISFSISDKDVLLTVQSK
ncbi:hypothetical protein [Desulfosporosinus sp. Sb-LF]|uniref:hypothetical protein n=1 Tax=Desulfosporosinus sp. Sb-LF TaxID=2560027 RepID=UPI00107FA292|nr:hypothetical protein [Desulfosporosinus sp. Sb-LF]TGE31958.1 hypothetical protein E4K68_14825 [Desulfosporosinus sp. Sb-LF]